MRALPWLLGGGAVAAVAGYFWHREHRTAQADDLDNEEPTPVERPQPPGNESSPAPRPSGQPARPEPLPGRWVWPVGVWHGRKPEISDGYTTQRRQPDGQLRGHGGVDIMYRRQPADPWRAGTPNATPGWVMPDHRAALAASDGVIWSAALTPRGWTVVIDHSPRKLATYYTHMSSLLVTAKQTVTAGTPLGIIGADPLDGQHIMHLHLEVWRGGSAARIDPQPLIERSWEYLPDPGDLPRALVARNAAQRSRDRPGYVVSVQAHTRRPPRR